MAEAHYLSDKDGKKFYPYAHASATYDNNGNTVEKRLKALDETTSSAVQSVKIGTTEYKSGTTVTLPSYPTSLPASDVPSWAKQKTKPTYTANEVGLGNVGNFKAVSTVESQGLTDTEKSNARANIGAQVVGSYASFTHNHDDKYQAKGSYASASHTHDDRYYTETEINTKLNGKANSSHTHGNGDITSLDASKITSGTISIDRLPQGALERLIVVADDTARFKLTSSTIQKGDTVKVTATGKMYYVVDETKLSSEAGYEVYAAGTAASVPWSGVTNKPSTYTPSSHTHTKSQITDFPTSMPASDVSAWAKASTKPSYSKSEVGLGNVDNTADSTKSVKYATSASSATSATNSSNVTKNTNFNDSSVGRISYYDAEISNTTNNASWSAPSKGWHQIYHNDLSVGGYWTEMAFPVNDVNGLAWRQRRNDQYYGWYRILDSNNYGNYTVGKTGSGASGTWRINVTGSSASCTGNATTATNASKVNNHTVESDVPANAKFTDTNTWRPQPDWNATSGDAVIKNKPTIPSVGNGTVTITQNGTSKGTFTMNQSGNTTIALTDTNTDTNTVTNIGTTASNYTNGNILIQGSGATTVSKSGNTVTISSTNTDTNTWRPLGTTADTACAGNDSRLSNARPANGGTSTYANYVWATSHQGSWYQNSQWDGTYFQTNYKNGDSVLPMKVNNAGYADSAGSVAWSNVSGRPSSMPASDVYSWAKASSKPSYTASEVGAAPANHSHSNYLTGITKSMVVNALGYTPPTTDTNTWRGVQNNLTSTATDQSLSAYQGKVLRDMIHRVIVQSSEPTISTNDEWLLEY